MIWQTQDGRRMPISKMSFTHLYNAIRMVLKNAEAELELSGAMELEPMDSPCLFPDETMTVFDFLSPAAQELIREYQKRVSKAKLSKSQRRALRLDDGPVLALKVPK